MPTKESKWKIVAEIGMTDNGLLSEDQEAAESNYTGLLADEEQRAGARIPDEALATILQAQNEAMSPEQALAIVQNYRNNPRVMQQAPTPIQPPQPVEPQIENPIAQEDVMNVDSTVEQGSAPPVNPLMNYSKYKDKKKKHLKGKGPVADKANEIYHAIMRDNGKDEPSKEEQASAAAIAWSQAKKHMKKKTYFRGVEAKVLDSYRGMWGEELVRISVRGETIDVPRESLQFESVEAIDPVNELKTFVSSISDGSDTRSQIRADIANLKTAKDIAYRLIVSNELTDMEERSVDSLYEACENRIANLERRLVSDMNDDDRDYLESQPKYEIGGYGVAVSSFTQTDSGSWLDEAVEKMAAEAEGLDLEKLVQDDPIVLVASLSEEVIANAVAVKNLALERVREAAGSLDQDLQDQVITAYVEKTEHARRRALASVKNSAKQEVEQQTKTANSVPDEGLFL